MTTEDNKDTDRYVEIILTIKTSKSQEEISDAALRLAAELQVKEMGYSEIPVTITDYGNGQSDKLSIEEMREIIERGEGPILKFPDIETPELTPSDIETFTAIDRKTGKPVAVNGQVVLFCKAGDKVEIANRKL